MILANPEECKKSIRKLGFNFKEFSEEAGIDYPYLIKALNGDFVPPTVRSAFDKFKIPYQAKPLSKRSAA
jgi:predicted transcriptional regulator